MTIQRRLLKMKQPPVLSTAERYQKDKVPMMFEPLARRFLEHVPLNPGDRVLDVACGTGIVARLVASIIGQNGRVTGIDISADMLRVAKSLTGESNDQVSASAIAWKLGEAANLPVEDESFDLALCQQGFQYFPDQESALGEMCRALTPGGRLALCVSRAVDPRHQPYQWAKVKALTRFAGQEAGQQARQITPFFRGDAAMLTKMMADAGFREVKVKNIAFRVQMGPMERFIHEDAFPELNNDIQMAVVKQLQRAMVPYLNRQGVAIPYGLHIATAVKA